MLSSLKVLTIWRGRKTHTHTGFHKVRNGREGSMYHALHSPLLSVSKEFPHHSHSVSNLQVGLGGQRHKGERFRE